MTVDQADHCLHETIRSRPRFKAVDLKVVRGDNMMRIQGHLGFMSLHASSNSQVQRRPCPNQVSS